MDENNSLKQQIDKLRAEISDKKFDSQTETSLLELLNQLDGRIAEVEKKQIDALSQDEELDIEKAKKNENIEQTYDVAGLLIGGSIGLLIGIFFFNAIFAMQIGMFLGLVAGVRMKKKKPEQTEVVPTENQQ
jgi:F0F1-type ATP synthase assembly protein I